MKVADYMAKERGMTTKEFLEERPQVLQDELVAATTELAEGKGFGASGAILLRWANQNPKSWAPLAQLHNQMMHTNWDLPRNTPMTPALRAALKDKYGVDVNFFTKEDVGRNYFQETSAPRTGPSGGMLKGRNIEEVPKADIPKEIPKTEASRPQWMLNQRRNYDTTGEWMQAMTKLGRKDAAEAWRLHQEQTGGGPMAVPEPSEPQVFSKPSRNDRMRLIMNDKGLSSYDARLEDAKLRAQGNDFNSIEDMENHLHGKEFDESRMSLPKKESFSDTPLGLRPKIDIKPSQALDNMKRLRDSAISKAHDMAKEGVPGTEANLKALGEKINAMNKRIAEIEKTTPDTFNTPELGPGREQDLSGITRMDPEEIARRKAMVKDVVPKEELPQEAYRRPQSIPDSRQISPIGKDRIDNRMPEPKPETGYTLTLNTRNWSGQFTVDNMGRIVDAPKQAKWSVGKELSEVLDYYKKKKILKSTGNEGSEYVLQTKSGDRWETLSDEGKPIVSGSEEGAINARNLAVKRGHYAPDDIRVWEVPPEEATKPVSWREKEGVGQAPSEESARAVATTKTGNEALDKILGRKAAERKGKSRAEQTLDRIFGTEEESRMSRPKKPTTEAQLEELYRKTMAYGGDMEQGTIRNQIITDPYARARFYNIIKNEINKMPTDTPSMKKLVGKAQDLLKEIKDPKDPESATKIELAAEWMHEGLRRQIPAYEKMLVAEYGEEAANRIIDKLWNKYDLEGTEVEGKMSKPKSDLHSQIEEISKQPNSTNNVYALGKTITKEQAIELWEEYRRRTLESEKEHPDLWKEGEVGKKLRDERAAEVFLNQAYRETVEGYLHKGDVKGRALGPHEITSRLGLKKGAEE
jgi:hypothetical protein